MSDTPLPEDDASSIFDELASVMPDSFFSVEEQVVEPVEEQVDDGEPQPFAFGQDKGHPPERLTSLERASEKMVRALKAVIEPFARTRAQVTAPALEITPYGTWQAKLPAFTSLSLYRLRPLKGGMLVMLEPEFVAALVESFYGGNPAAARKPRAGDFTASEELLLKRLLERLVAVIAEHWREMAPVEPLLAQRETSIGHINFMRHDEPVVVQRFTIAAGAQPSTITILYPLAMLRPIEARMVSKVHDDNDDGGDTLWRARLSEALGQVRLPVRSVLARPEISVAQLLTLKVGDVIPITLAPHTPLLAGTHRIADGVIGEQEGRAALMIEKVGNE